MQTLNAKRLRNSVKLFLPAESPINRRIKAHYGKNIQTIGSAESPRRFSTIGHWTGV
jgi:hypothetical protein